MPRNGERGSWARCWEGAPAATPCRAAASIPTAAARKSPSPRRSTRRGWRPPAVGHVNAHGSANRVSDLAEARAFRRIFGPGGVPVTALKGYMGNLASGCGAVDMMVSLIGVNRGKIPPILNCEELDPEMELDVVLEFAASDREPDLRDDEPDTQRPGGGPRDSRLPR